jgi:hypothetical protein
MSEEIDPTNAQLAGRQGDQVVVVLPRGRMSREEALTHAAWLVTLAEGEDEFGAYLKAVQGT